MPASLRPTAHQILTRVKIPAGSGSTHLPRCVQQPHDMMYCTCRDPANPCNALQDRPSVPQLRVRGARLFQHLVFAPRQPRWQQMIDWAVCNAHTTSTNDPCSPQNKESRCRKAITSAQWRWNAALTGTRRYPVASDGFSYQVRMTGLTTKTMSTRAVTMPSFLNHHNLPVPFSFRQIPGPPWRYRAKQQPRLLQPRQPTPTALNTTASEK